MPVIVALGRQRQEGSCDFRVNMRYKLLKISSKQKSKGLLKVKVNKFLLRLSYFYLEEKEMTSVLDITGYFMSN